MKKISNYVFVALFGFLVFNFFIKSKAEADANDSYRLYLEGKAVFIDVREKSEVEDGMIKGALWFPLSKIQQDQTAEIKKIKDLLKGKDVFVYCKSGNRSSKVQAYLEEAGTKAINMGAYSNLVQEKLPTQLGPIN